MKPEVRIDRIMRGCVNRTSLDHRVKEQLTRFGIETLDHLAEYYVEGYVIDEEAIDMAEYLARHDLAVLVVALGISRGKGVDH